MPSCLYLMTDRETFVQNYKESFLFESDTSSFSRLVKSLLVRDALEIHHLEGTGIVSPLTGVRYSIMPWSGKRSTIFPTASWLILTASNNLSLFNTCLC